MCWKIMKISEYLKEMFGNIGKQKYAICPEHYYPTAFKGYGENVLGLKAEKKILGFGMNLSKFDAFVRDGNKVIGFRCGVYLTGNMK
jgi:hypothetical protein